MHIFYFQEEKCFEKDGQTLKSKKCSVDIAKIRTLKLFSNSGKNGGPYLSNYCAKSSFLHRLSRNR